MCVYIYFSVVLLINTRSLIMGRKQLPTIPWQRNCGYQNALQNRIKNIIDFGIDFEMIWDPKTGLQVASKKGQKVSKKCQI